MQGIRHWERKRAKGRVALTVEVTLSKGMVAIIDDEDADRVLTHKWSVSSRGKKKLYYAYRTVSVGEKQTAVYMHRFLLGLVAGDGLVADHIDGDTLNNRKSNLRVATSAQNGWNRSKMSAVNKYKGISLIKETGLWDARIHANNQRYYLGHFKTEEEAALAYNEAACRLHGEFARLNEVAR